MGWEGTEEPTIRRTAYVGALSVHNNARLRGQSPGLELYFYMYSKRLQAGTETPVHDYIAFPFDGAYQLFVGECHPCVVVV